MRTYDRARMHRALDAVMDAAGLRWESSPPPSGKYASFQNRAWPTAYYQDGSPAVALYADKPYSKQNADDGSTITVTIADYSVGKSEEGRRQHGSFKWRTLVQRASSLKQAKQLAEGFISHKPEYAP